MIKKEQEFLTYEQVAELLCVTVRTVHRMTERGKIPQPYRFSGKLIRWHKGELMAYLEDPETRKKFGLTPIVLERS